MKVVIVAKTRMGRAACIGGLTFAGESVRLIAADREYNESAGMEYEIGDVWEVQATRDPELLPPHIENIIVQEKRRLPRLDNITAFIERHMPPQVGGPEELYEGLTRTTPFGSLYISQETGVPSFSTMFWRPDRPLVKDTEGMRIRYRYPAEDGDRKLAFVGFQEAIGEIPAGTLLRVSLAHWWRPMDRPDMELRCYVQLSGWFFPAEEHWSAEFAGFDSEPELDSTRILVPRPTLVGAGRAKAVAVRPTLDDAYTILNDTFGFDEFRPLQAEIIERVFEGDDTVAIMPTGSGKSLCYQLPALLLPGLTVVVSPLIALMQDQVDALRQLAIPAAFLNSTLSYAQYLEVKRRVLAGDIKLLYVAPETLLRPETLELLSACRVDCLTVDEAHCISEWGHDFRPEYRQLVTIRRRSPDAVCLALTATATERVQDDIVRSLEMPDAERFVASFDRPNLFLSAQPRTDATAQLLAFLEGRGAQAGIIYCPTKNGVDETAAFLQANLYEALAYHAGLEDDVRRAHQRRFIREDGVIIVATIAFGMGIDKPDVRYVVHQGLPKDMESYYQQIGRAGRDGLPADCLLLYSFTDSSTINYFINQQARDQQAAARQRLNRLVSYAETNGCRRIPLLEYFGEVPAAQTCGHCDNCRDRGQVELTDVTVAAQKFLSCVKRTGEIFGATHVIKVLRGSREKSLLDRRHDRLSTYGVGREYTQKEWNDLAEQFISQGLVTRDPEYGSLRLTPKAYDVFKGQTVMARAPERRAEFAGRVEEELEYDQELFGILRAKRLELATEAEVPPYFIFGDRTLIEMAAYYPQTPAELSTLYGVGRYKLETYGTVFIDLILEYCFPRGIESRAKPSGRSRSRSSTRKENGLSVRTMDYVNAYKDGMSVDNVAEQFSVKPSTVFGHLWRYVHAGNELPEDDLRSMLSVSADEENEVQTMFSEHGFMYLGPVYYALDQRVSYDDLSIIRILMVLADRSLLESTEPADSD